MLAAEACKFHTDAPGRGPVTITHPESRDPAPRGTMASRLGRTPRSQAGSWQAVRLGALAAIAITLNAPPRAAAAPDAARAQ
jgi:hypothetical protein